MPVYDISHLSQKNIEAITKARAENLAKLKEAYDNVKNHQYRVDRAGRLSHYITAFEDMIHIFSGAISLYADMPYDFASTPNMLFHEIYHFLKRVEDSRKDHGEQQHSSDLIVLERYLVQVHHFIDTKKIDEFSVYLRGEWYKFRYFPDVRVYSVVDEHIDKYVNNYFQMKNPDKEELERIKRFSERGDIICRCHLSIYNRLSDAHDEDGL